MTESDPQSRTGEERNHEFHESARICPGYTDTRNQRASGCAVGGLCCRPAAASKLASRAASPDHPRLRRRQPIDSSGHFHRCRALSIAGAEWLHPTQSGGQRRGRQLASSLAMGRMRLCPPRGTRGQPFRGIRADSCNSWLLPFSRLTGWIFDSHCPGPIYG